MYCRQCGDELPKNNPKFCITCGANVIYTGDTLQLNQPKEIPWPTILPSGAPMYNGPEYPRIRYTRYKITLGVIRMTFEQFLELAETPHITGHFNIKEMTYFGYPVEIIDA